MSIEEAEVIFSNESKEQSNTPRSPFNSLADGDTTKSTTDKGGGMLTPEVEAGDQILSNENENMTASIIKESSTNGGKESPSAVSGEDEEMIVIKEADKQFQTRSEDGSSGDGDEKTLTNGTGSASGETELLSICLPN